MAIGNPTSIGTASLLSTGGTATLTTSANVIAGNLLVAVIVANSGTPTNATSVSDGTNNYTNAIKTTNVAGSTSAEIWYVANAQAVGAGATLSYILGNAAANGLELTAVQITGIQLVSPLDKTPAAQNNSATPSVATGVLTQPIEIILGLIGLGGTNPSGLAESPNFTTIYNHRTANNNVWIDFGYDIVASTASVNYAPVPTGIGSLDNSVVVATFIGTQSLFVPYRRNKIIYRR